MMEKRLNVLVIEDLEDYVFLLMHHLKRNNYTVTHRHVSNEKELREALEKGNWDLVIANYSMSQLTSLKSLRIFNEYQLNIPFIFLSGTTGEELAVEAIKSGANDYIMKDKLDMLVSSIERELNEAQKRREKEEVLKRIKESEEDYRVVVENAQDIIATISREGIITSINDAVKIIGNWEKEELIGVPLNDVVHPDDQELILQEFQNTLNRKENREYVIRIKKKNGQYLYGSVESNLLKKDGKVKGILVFIRDVTQKKELEERITILSKATNQSPVSVIIVDLEGKISYVNDMVLRTTGYSIDEIKMLNPKDVIASEFPDEDYQKMWSDVKIYESWKGEFYSKTKDRKLYWEEVVITPIKDENGEVLRYLILKNDITKRKEIFSELLLAKKEAEAANNLKSEFLAQMSHEIRTPLNTILSFTQILKDELEDQVNDDLKICFTGVDNAGNRIIRTIDLLLNMTELQVGSYKANYEKIDIYEEILESLILEKITEAKMKGIQLSLSKLTDATVLFVDRYSVTQIFDNLIGNAIKYTNSGKIEVKCFTNDFGKTSVSVSDTGIGIASENLQKIFNAFTQEDQGYTRHYEGNGLGLTLVKQYCDLNRATISVDSSKGVGSTFLVTFNY